MDYDLTDEQIDQLMTDMETPVNEVMPDDNPPPKQEQTDQPFMTLKASGREVAGTREQIEQWASQGYDYGRLMNEFKQKQSEFDQKSNEFQSKYDTYAKIDQYAKDNPDWWNNIQNNYGQAVNNQALPQEGGDDPISQALEGLRSELNELRQKDQQREHQELVARQQREDQELDQTIQSVRQNYPDLDWSGMDVNGKNLETRILEHAQKIGSNDFNVAFKDLMFDEVMSRKISMAKDEVTKAIKRNQTLGLLGETPEPLAKALTAGEAKGKSYDDLLSEAMIELGIAN